MGQMADGSGNFVVGVCIQKDRQGFQALKKFLKGADLFFGNFFSRRQHIIGIFQKHGSGVCVAALFRAGHGMPADEMLSDPELFHLPVDLSLDAAYIA